MTKAARALAAHLETLASVLRRAAARDAELNGALGGLGKALEAYFADLTAGRGASGEAPGKRPEGAAADSRATDRTAGEGAAVGRSPREFRADIRWVPERARLKAEACEAALKASRRERAAGDEQPEHAELYARAKALPECYLWALDPKRPPAPEPEFEVARDCYLNLAAVVELAHAELQQAERDGDSAEVVPPRRLMSLMAEAQSAIYAMLSRLNIRGDRDQLQVFAWLRERTDHFRIYIPRFMDRTRLAKPEDAPDLTRRIAAFAADRRRERDAAEVSSKLRYRLEKAAERDDELSSEWWPRVAESLEERASHGGRGLEQELVGLLSTSLERLRDPELGLSSAALDWLGEQLEPGEGKQAADDEE